jgi:hypothetical protein
LRWSRAPVNFGSGDFGRAIGGRQLRVLVGRALQDGERGPGEKLVARPNAVDLASALAIGETGLVVAVWDRRPHAGAWAPDFASRQPNSSPEHRDLINAAGALGGPGEDVDEAYGADADHVS